MEAGLRVQTGEPSPASPLPPRPAQERSYAVDSEDVNACVLAEAEAIVARLRQRETTKTRLSLARSEAQEAVKNALETQRADLERMIERVPEIDVEGEEDWVRIEFLEEQISRKKRVRRIERQQGLLRDRSLRRPMEQRVGVCRRVLIFNRFISH